MSTPTRVPELIAIRISGPAYDRLKSCTRSQGPSRTGLPVAVRLNEMSRGGTCNCSASAVRSIARPAMNRMLRARERNRPARVCSSGEMTRSIPKIAASSSCVLSASLTQTDPAVCELPSLGNLKLVLNGIGQICMSSETNTINTQRLVHFRLS